MSRHPNSPVEKVRWSTTGSEWVHWLKSSTDPKRPSFQREYVDPGTKLEVVPTEQRGGVPEREVHHNVGGTGEVHRRKRSSYRTWRNVILVVKGSFVSFLTVHIYRSNDKSEMTSFTEGPGCKKVPPPLIWGRGPHTCLSSLTVVSINTLFDETAQVGWET